VRFPAYRVVHVLLHFIHIMAIELLDISCQCPREYPSHHLKSLGDYGRRYMMPTYSAHPLAPSLGLDTGPISLSLPSGPSKSKGHGIVFLVFADSVSDTWIVSLPQIRVATYEAQYCYAFPRVLFLPMNQFSLLVPALVVIFSSLALGISTGTTRTMDTPLTCNKSLNKSTTNVNSKPHIVQKRANDKVQAAYFSNWYVMDCPSLRSIY
jgi:hypothetical protein